jgi:outer membrane receptor protein involved in Fe transport
MRLNRILLAGVAVSALSLPLRAQAVAQAAAEATATGSNEDIIVTAQRREQPAEDVGIALSVIGGKELQRRGVTTLNQLQYQTPSLEITPAFGGGQPNFRLRGVGFDDYAANNTPTVGVYVDQVTYPIPVMTQGALFDIERVEVLRGPQGTLYGRNTTGGAINFITRKPTDAFSAGIDGEFGRFDLAKVEGYVSGPLSETLKFRVSAITEQGGGFQVNRVTGQHLGDADRLFGRALLEWTPTSGVDVTLNVHGGRDKSENTGLYLFDAFPTQGYGGPAGPIIPADSYRQTGWGFSPAFAALTGINASDKPHRDNQSYGGSLDVDVDIGAAVRLTSITAYDHFKRREYDDWDASASHESDTFWGSNDKVFSQEVRLAPISPTRFTWVVGGYYSYQKIDDDFITDFSQSLGFITDTSYTQKVNSIAGFGQGEYKLTDSLSLIAGARFEHEDRKLRNFQTAINGTPTFTDGNRNANFSKVTGKIELDYHVTHDLLLYASASRGVKSGGFTAHNSPYASEIDAFKPETLYAYETGFKADIAHRLTLNGSAYYYDYRNQQVEGIVVDPVVGAIGQITNAPKSKIYGGELELTYTPIKPLRLTQSLGYTYGKYVRYNAVDPTSVLQNGPGGTYTYSTINLAGEKLPFANWSYQGSATVTLPAGSEHGVEVAGDYSYRSSSPSFLGPVYTLNSFWLVNATITLRPSKGSWYIGLYGRNLLNEKYDLTRNYFLPNAKIAAPGRPASYGVRFGVGF